MQLLLYIAIFLLILCFAGLVIILSFLLPVIQGAPFVASDKNKLQTIIKFVNIKKGQKALDIGSGDGRIVIALAKAGARAYGFEFNPFLIWLSRRSIKKAGLQDKAQIKKANFWKEDLSSFDIITVFGITHMMDKLGKKLKDELKPGSRVISNGFHIPGWGEEMREDGIILYIK